MKPNQPIPTSTSRPEKASPAGNQRSRSRSSFKNLAVFGAPPSFSESLHVNRPSTPDRNGLMKRLESIVEGRWFTNSGPLVEELEEKLADYLGVKHCVLTCNGTIALQLAIRALEIEGEVIIPSFTFVSTAHTLLWLGIEPVFCDVDPKTWNIDPKACEPLITSKTSAIIGVHLWGRPCNTRELGRLAAQHGLRLLFDAAHAFGCEHEGILLGPFGEAEVFSFHATKAFHTGEGGAVTTNDDSLAERLRLTRNFGFVGHDEVSLVGTNAKMPETSAAIGLRNLEQIDSLFEKNLLCYKAYRDGLHGIAGLRVLAYAPLVRHNRHYVVIEVQPEAELNRDELLRVLHAENVLARRYFYPGTHRMQPYISRRAGNESALPQTEQIAQRVLVLPAGSALSLRQVAKVCGIVRRAVGEAARIRTHLGASTIR